MVVTNRICVPHNIESIYYLSLYRKNLLILELVKVGLSEIKWCWCYYEVVCGYIVWAQMKQGGFSEDDVLKDKQADNGNKKQQGS